MSRRLTAVLLVASLTPGLAACGSPARSKGGSSTRASRSVPVAPPSSSATAQSFTGRHMIIAVNCTADPVEVAGFDPDTGKEVARRTFAAPRQDGYGGCGDGTRETRQLFDRDFDRMVVSIHDDRDGGDHVGYVDAGGKLHDLTGRQGSGFGDQVPHELRPVYDRIDNHIWFTGPGTFDAKVYSRDVTTGALTERGTLDGKYGLFVYQGHQRATAFPLYQQTWLTNPASTALWDGSDPTNHRLEFKALVNGQDTETTAEIPTDYSGCSPAGWVDDHTMLCAEIDYSGPARTANFFTISLADDFSSVKQVSDRILPDNDRDNKAMAIAPDGSELIFCAERGETTEYYRVKLAPDAQPRTVAWSSLPDGYGIVEWR